MSSLPKKYVDGDKSSSVVAYLAMLEMLAEQSPEIYKNTVEELETQRSTLKMIASENYASLTVQLTAGNLFTDKYAEGIPGRRFYGGCERIDKIENGAIELAKNLFGCDHAYLQPHSGSDANLIAFWAVITKRIEKDFLRDLNKKSTLALSKEEYSFLRTLFPKQKIVALSMDAGGHLTHGSRVNISSKMFDFYHYGVNEKGVIDYSEIEKLVLKEKPLILLAGYSSYPRILDFSILKKIADSAGSTFIVDMAHFSGLVAGKVLCDQYNPIPYADIVTSTTHKTLRGPRGGLILCTNEYAPFIDKGCPLVMGGPMPHIIASKYVALKEALDPSFKVYAHQVVKNAQALADSLKESGVKLITDGTDNHIIVMDTISSFGINGMKCENIMCDNRIVVNRNVIPNDPNGGWITSGVRLGSAALTTRGMKEEEMREIGYMICDLIRGRNISNRMKTLLERFPLYPSLGTLGGSRGR